MFKKINLILVGIGLALTLKYNIGFVFLISVLLFYLYKDSKNLLYLMPSISLSSLLFIYDTFLNVIILELIIVLFFILLNSLKITRFRIYIYCVFIALLNIFGFYILNLNYSFLNFLLLIIISILIYLFLCFEDYIYLNNIIKNPTLYVDHIIVIIAVLNTLYMEFR